jgi:hypothetical protein
MLSTNREFPSDRILVLRSSTDIIPDPHTASPNCDKDYSWIKPENIVNVDKGGIMADFGKLSILLEYIEF